MKNKLDELRAKYEVKEFIENDPIQFPHRFKTLEEIEISGFLASGFAYGKRELFIQKLNLLFEIMEILLNALEQGVVPALIVVVYLITTDIIKSRKDKNSAKIL